MFGSCVDDGVEREDWIVVPEPFIEVASDPNQQSELVRAATARHIKSNSLAPTLVVILLRALDFVVCIAVLVPWPGVVLDSVEDEVLVALTVAGFAAPTAVLQYAV